MRNAWMEDPGRGARGKNLIKVLAHCKVDNGVNEDIGRMNLPKKAENQRNLTSSTTSNHTVICRFSTSALSVAVSCRQEACWFHSCAWARHCGRLFKLTVLSLANRFIHNDII